jgi:hypothetical protein
MANRKMPQRAGDHHRKWLFPQLRIHLRGNWRGTITISHDSHNLAGEELSRSVFSILRAQVLDDIFLNLATNYICSSL